MEAKIRDSLTLEKKTMLIEYQNNYKTEYNDITSLANKLGWSQYDIQMNPFLFIHVVFEYLEIIS